MAVSRRHQVIQVFATRLAAIQVGLFNTDAGSTVLFGEMPEMGPDDPDEAIAVTIGEEDPTWQGEHVFYELPIVIHALAKADLDNPWMSVEALLQDIKRAVELEDRSLDKLLRGRLERGPTRSMEREPGSTFIGASVTYLAPIAEKWGTP